MNSKQARRIRQELGIKPPKNHISIKDRRHYRRLGNGQIVCIGARRAYKAAKKAKQRELRNQS